MPGTQSLTVGKEQLSLQMFKHLKEYRELRRMNYPLFDDWFDNVETWDGSDTMIIPWDEGNHSEPTPLVTGYERYSDTVQNTMFFGTMTPAWVVQPILKAEIDEKINSGPGKVIDKTAKNLKNVDRHLRANFQKILFRGTASSGSYVAPYGFSAWNHFNGEDFSTGFIEVLASGTNTLHGVNKATYSVTNGDIQFHNLYFDAGSAAGTNLANQMFQACVQLQLQDQWPQASEFTWYSSLNAFVFLKRSFRSLEQYVQKGAIDDADRLPVGPGGCPIKVTGDLPQDGANTATDKFSVIGLNWARGAKPYLFEGWKMDLTKFVEVQGTAGVMAALMKVGGNTGYFQPGLQVVIKNAEVY